MFRINEIHMKVYILVGNIGSGKSSWAKEKRDLEITKDPPGTIGTLYPQIINQDTEGSRDKCLELADVFLTRGHEIIIDRTNINKFQRSNFINLAKKYNAEVHCIEFVADKKLCLERVLNRKDHPTIKNMSEEKIKSIIERFFKQYEVPEMSEGFSSMVRIHVNNLPGSNIKSS